MSDAIFTAEEPTAREFLRLVQLSMNRMRAAPNVNAQDPFQRRHAGPGRKQYEGARDYSTVLGRSGDLGFEDYYELYERGGMAGVIIDVRAGDTWGEPPTVTENDDAETEFVKAFDNLVEQHHFWEVMRRADLLSGIGEYGVLLFGLAGKEDLSEPVKRGQFSGPDGLLYMRPFSEGGASIATFDEDVRSKRCGFPLLYDVQINGDKTVKVHHSRVLHITEYRTDSEVYGRPWLKRPYDTLMDMLYKILGGSAEAAWLNMRKGAVIGPKEGYDWDLDDSTELGGFKDQLEAYAHDLARFLLSGGVEVQEIGGADVWDPRSAFDIHVDVVAAESRIPKHILLGSAAGELASSQADDRRWAGTIRRRQNTYIVPRVLRPCLDRLIWYGVLPEPADGYEIGTEEGDGNRNWPSIIQMTDEEAANVALRRATGAKQFMDPATGAMPITKKEQRTILGLPADVPDNMQEDPEGLPEPPEPVAEPGGPAEPGMDGVPEMPQGEPEIVEPPGELDEDEERARANEEAYIASLFVGSHTPTIVDSVCPLCGFVKAEHYEGHGPLLRCANCKRTYDPTVEGMNVIMHEEANADAQATD